MGASSGKPSHPPPPSCKRKQPTAAELSHAAAVLQRVYRGHTARRIVPMRSLRDLARIEAAADAHAAVLKTSLAMPDLNKKTFLQFNENVHPPPLRADAAGDGPPP
jgi:hypothetical protein